MPFCGLLALRALFRTWGGRLPRLSGVLGILVWSAAAIAIALPKLTILVAATLGIGRGADLVFYLAILGGVGVSFYFYQRSRQLENLITALDPPRSGPRWTIRFATGCRQERLLGLARMIHTL